MMNLTTCHHDNFTDKSVDADVMKPFNEVFDENATMHFAPNDNDESANVHQN